MTHEEIIAIRRSLLGDLRREKNGAVVDAVDALVTKTLFSYGVSLPTLKTIVAPYKNNHALALELYQSNVRELKLAAIYIDDPAEVTFEQIKQWSESLSTLELIENITFALLSRTVITAQIIAHWGNQKDPLFAKGIELLKMHHARRFPTPL